MAKKTPIYYLCFCDEWKFTDSMHPIIMTTDPANIRRQIVKEIKSGTMGYATYDDDFESDNQKIKAMTDSFLEDWATCDKNTINDRLIYGFYSSVIDGKEI